MQINVYTQVYFGPDCIPPHLLHTESSCFHQDRPGKIQSFPVHSEFSCYSLLDPHKTLREYVKKKKKKESPLAKAPVMVESTITLAAFANGYI